MFSRDSARVFRGLYLVEMPPFHNSLQHYDVLEPIARCSRYLAQYVVSIHKTIVSQPDTYAISLVGIIAYLTLYYMSV